MSTLLAILIPIILIVIVYLLNHFKIISIITPAKDLSQFIQDLLKDVEWANNFEKVLTKIVRVLTLVQSSSDPTLTNDQKVGIASDIIVSELAEDGVTLTASDITMMNEILQVGFVFLGSLHFSGPAVLRLHKRVVKMKWVA